MKKLLLAPVLFCLAFAWAKEYWMVPQKFFFTIREVAHIRFREGSADRTDSPTGIRNTVAHLLHYGASGNPSDIANLVPDTKSDSIRLPLREEGTQMVIFNSTNTILTPGADSVRTYLREAGLDAALAGSHSKEENRRDTLYVQQSLKTIFQVGGRVTDACIGRTILPLEIIPESNPYQVPQGTNSTRPLRVRFQLLYGGEPLQDAPVQMRYRGTDNRWLTDTARTNRRGWVTLDRHSGPVILSSAHLIRLEGSAGWQCFQTSLSFEFSRFQPGKSAIYTEQP